MRLPLIAGNWKMNGSKTEAVELLSGIKAGAGDIAKAEITVCPPFPYLYLAEQALAGSNVSWGGQDVAREGNGAFTGNVSATMLNDFGCKYVIVGHSERRQYYGETDVIIARKFAQAVQHGLIPILCVGETLEERETGKTESVVAEHLDGVINLGGIDVLRKGLVAYEPVWAIGTGVTASPEQAQDVHAFLRARVAAKSQEVADGLRILYGGSMKPDNADELIGKPDIDGGLIGGAALKAEDFLAICKAGDARS